MQQLAPPKMIKHQGKKFTGTGRNLIYSFLEKTSEQIFNEIFTYSHRSMEEGFNNHAFWHGEEQVKGQIASALSKSCNGLFLTEPKVTRRRLKDGDTQEENNKTNERADFWCRFGVEGRKIDVLIEAKHSWGRWWNADKHTIYKYSAERHMAAKKQINCAIKKEYIVDHLFAAALTVLPVYYRHKSDAEESCNLTNENIELMTCSTGKIFSADFSFAMKLPDEINKIMPVIGVSGKEVFESYPMLMLIWSVNKIHRDRC